MDQSVGFECLSPAAAPAAGLDVPKHKQSHKNNFHNPSDSERSLSSHSFPILLGDFWVGCSFVPHFCAIPPWGSSFALPSSCWHFWLHFPSAANSLPRLGLFHQLYTPESSGNAHEIPLEARAGAESGGLWAELHPQLWAPLPSTGSQKPWK